MRARVRLNLADKNGKTERDKLLAQLKAAKAAGGYVGDLVARLREPPIPPAGRYLWDWFWQLDATRDIGMATERIKHREIAAWRENTGNRPSPIDIEILQAMDTHRIAATNTTSREGQPATAASLERALSPFIKKERKPKIVA